MTEVLCVSDYENHVFTVNENDNNQKQEES